MAAKICTLCDAVTSFINGQSYTLPFVATRSNVPVRALENSAGLIVEVFPGEYTVAEETRADWRYEYSVNIAVSKVITADDRQADEDALLEIAEEIEDSLKNEPMGDFKMMSVSTGAGPRTHFNPDRLLAAGQFIAVLEIVYVG